MLFRKQRKPDMSFKLPRTETLRLDISIMAGALVWSPAVYWEQGDTNYFAATALPLQTLTFRAPAGFAPSRIRHSAQLPNIAGRWVLKLNPAQARKTGDLPTEKFLGWAETHAHYTTFTHAELVIWIAPGCADEARLAVLNLLAAHCAALHDRGGLRVLTACEEANSLVKDCCYEEGTTQVSTVKDFGSFLMDRNKTKVPVHTVYDVVPAEWGRTKERGEARKAFGWLRKNGR
jgi:hypothetical protein